ncbi:MAG: hypothetical protein GYA32_15770 [Serratia sp.]|nr:hypothetical protein [Serratia sp. (in: enterobacteria)]
MKERPILFNSEMVQAILSGRKTQTRRVIQSPARTMQANNINCISYREPGDKWYQDYVFSMRDRSGTWQDYTKEQFLAKCPLGKPGDHLWVRETFATLGNEDGCAIDWKENLVKAGGPDATRIYRASCEQRPGNYGLWSVPDDAFWKPHTDNMQYEGSWVPSIHMPRWASRINLLITGVRVERLNDISQEDAKSEGCCYGRGGGVPDLAVSPADHFPTLWESIYGIKSWAANPWVWVIEFERVAPAGEQS